jgi:hypothetical protein
MICFSLDYLLPQVVVMGKKVRRIDAFLGSSIRKEQWAGV